MTQNTRYIFPLLLYIFHNPFYLGLFIHFFLTSCNFLVIKSEIFTQKKSFTFQIIGNIHYKDLNNLLWIKKLFLEKPQHVFFLINLNILLYFLYKKMLENVGVKFQLKKPKLKLSNSKISGQ